MSRKGLKKQIVCACNSGVRYCFTHYKNGHYTISTYYHSKFIRREEVKKDEFNMLINAYKLNEKFEVRELI